MFVMSGRIETPAIAEPRRLFEPLTDYRDIVLDLKEVGVIDRDVMRFFTYAQMPASRTSTSDAEKIASAMQAGPKFVTQNATVLDWPSSPGGEFRVLRAGTTAWTCLPGIPQGTHDEPGCFDQVFLEFMKDSMAGRTPNVQSVGISYMYGGF